MCICKMRRQLLRVFKMFQHCTRSKLSEHLNVFVLRCVWSRFPEQSSRWSLQLESLWTNTVQPAATRTIKIKYKIEWCNKQSCQTTEHTHTHTHTADGRKTELRKRGMLGNKRRPEWEASVTNEQRWSCYSHLKKIPPTRVAISTCVCARVRRRTTSLLDIRITNLLKTLLSSVRQLHTHTHTHTNCSFLV